MRFTRLDALMMGAQDNCETSRSVVEDYIRTQNVSSRIAVIEVKVTDPLRGGISSTAFGRHLLATERAPGIWRVNDGKFDFTFTQTELDNAVWIELIERVSDKL